MPLALYHVGPKGDETPLRYARGRPAGTMSWRDRQKIKLEELPLGPIYHCHWTTRGAKATPSTHTTTTCSLLYYYIAQATAGRFFAHMKWMCFYDRATLTG